LKGALQHILRKNEHLCLVNITAVKHFSFVNSFLKNFAKQPCLSYMGVPQYRIGLKKVREVDGMHVI